MTDDVVCPTPVGLVSNSMPLPVNSTVFHEVILKLASYVFSICVQSARHDWEFSECFWHMLDAWPFPIIVIRCGDDSVIICSLLNPGFVHKLCRHTDARTTAFIFPTGRPIGALKMRNLAHKIPNAFSTTGRALDSL